MRIRIVRTPGISSIDGIRLDRFELDHQYEVGNSLGALMLAEEWAIPEPLEEPAPAPPTKEVAPLEPPRPPPDADNPPNLIREVYPPYLDRLPIDLAAAFDRRKRPR